MQVISISTKAIESKTVRGVAGLSNMMRGRATVCALSPVSPRARKFKCKCAESDKGVVGEVANQSSFDMDIAGLLRLKERRGGGVETRVYSKSMRMKKGANRK